MNKNRHSLSKHLSVVNGSVAFLLAVFISTISPSASEGQSNMPTVQIQNCDAACQKAQDDRLSRDRENQERKDSDKEKKDQCKDEADKLEKALTDADDACAAAGFPDDKDKEEDTDLTDESDTPVPKSCAAKASKCVKDQRTVARQSCGKVGAAKVAGPIKRLNDDSGDDTPDECASLFPASCGGTASASVDKVEKEREQALQDKKDLEDKIQQDKDKVEKAQKKISDDDSAWEDRKSNQRKKEQDVITNLTHNIQNLDDAKLKAIQDARQALASIDAEYGKLRNQIRQAQAKRDATSRGVMSTCQQKASALYDQDQAKRAANQNRGNNQKSLNDLMTASTRFSQGQQREYDRCLKLAQPTVDQASDDITNLQNQLVEDGAALEAKRAEINKQLNEAQTQAEIRKSQAAQDANTQRNQIIQDYNKMINDQTKAKQENIAAWQKSQQLQAKDEQDLAEAPGIIACTERKLTCASKAGGNTDLNTKDVSTAAIKTAKAKNQCDKYAAAAISCTDRDPNLKLCKNVDGFDMPDPAPMNSTAATKGPAAKGNATGAADTGK